MGKTIILKNALELIARGTVDVQYPLRCAPRETLMDYAKDALSRYEDAVLTSARNSGGEDRCIECGEVGKHLFGCKMSKID